MLFKIGVFVVRKVDTFEINLKRFITSLRFSPFYCRVSFKARYRVSNYATPIEVIVTDWHYTRHYRKGRAVFIWCIILPLDGWTEANYVNTDSSIFVAGIRTEYLASTTQVCYRCDVVRLISVNVTSFKNIPVTLLRFAADIAVLIRLHKGLELTRQTTYKVVQIWPGRFVCKEVTVCPGLIWTTLYT